MVICDVSSKLCFVGLERFSIGSICGWDVQGEIIMDFDFGFDVMSFYRRKLALKLQLGSMKSFRRAKNFSSGNTY